MFAASALILLAQAAAPCASAAVPPLGGGAVLIRPVASFEPAPFERLGPATSSRKKPNHIQQTGGRAPETEPKADQPAEQCEAAITIA